MRKTVDDSKRTYVPVEDDTESPEQKRNTIYEKLKEHIPDAVGVLYWKEENKLLCSAEPMETENSDDEIPRY